MNLAQPLKLINIGFGNIVLANRVIAVISPESAPVKRVIQDAKEKGALIDATYGRRTRAVIIVDSGHVILAAIQPETVASRIVKENADFAEHTKTEGTQAPKDKSGNEDLQ